MAIAEKAMSSDQPSRAGNGGTQPQIAFRKPPAMRVVTKGWFTLNETKVDITTLEKQDGEQP